MAPWVMGVDSKMRRKKKRAVVVVGSMEEWTCRSIGREGLACAVLPLSLREGQGRRERRDGQRRKRRRAKKQGKEEPKVGGGNQVAIVPPLTTRLGEEASS